MTYRVDMKEEGLKNIVARDLFKAYDTTKILGNIDFAVAAPRQEGKQVLSEEYKLFYLWAEAKRGTQFNIYHSLVQLILTIGRARTMDKYMPPKYLGAFDAEKIAFIPYNQLLDTFALNDFNWQVTPSDHTTREFGLLLNRVTQILDGETTLYHYSEDGKELQKFIHDNFRPDSGEEEKIRINRNNFIHIYGKWRDKVMPSIAINWEGAKDAGLLGADFYLADILSEENKTLVDKLYVLLDSDRYVLDRKVDKLGLFSSLQATFNDGQRAHHNFWKHYQRPPESEYWDILGKPSIYFRSAIGWSHLASKTHEVMNAKEYTDKTLGTLSQEKVPSNKLHLHKGYTPTN